MKRLVFCGAALAAAAWAGMASGQQLTDNVVKLGVLTDMSSLYSDINGIGAVHAVEMAIEEFGGTIGGKKIEIVQGDVQNKADVAATIAGRWFDTEKVDVVLGTGASSSSIATARVAADKKKVYLATDPASSDLTGKLCNPYTVHWTYDTTALANGTGSAVVKAGGKSWFFLTADYAFGYALERDVTAVVKKAGGNVIGSVKHPINSSDFSSFLLQAQASKAQIIGLANAGGDTINSIKQASEFGIVKGGQKLAGLLVFVSDVHSLGLERAQGLSLTEAFYWDLNDKTRAFARKFATKNNGKMPTSVQAGFYSAALQYLNMVKSAGSDQSEAVMAKFKETRWDDPVFGRSYVRPDGRKMHDMYLFEVKKPSESKGAYDYYKLISTIPAEEAFRPMDQGECPMVKKS
jgi:branched-chain amino acid transport system substrate-binding protein